MFHDDVIKWTHFPRNWPLVRGIHRTPVNSPHKGQWRGALMFSLFCVWINDWVNNREASDLRRYLVHYDVSAMSPLHDWLDSGCMWNKMIYLPGMLLFVTSSKFHRRYLLHVETIRMLKFYIYFISDAVFSVNGIGLVGHRITQSRL